jgi:hypothetical protein
MGYARYPLIYGLFSGAVVALVIVAGIVFKDQLGFSHSLWFGYLAMLVALTFVFVGVKRYRDVEKGGVIKFFPALGMGLAIAVVAAIAYAAVWEVYLALTHYRFMDEYIASMVQRLHEKGVTGAALAEKMAEFDGYREIYRNPLLRFGMTMVEILPVGVLMALVSATTLMHPSLVARLRRLFSRAQGQGRTAR